MSKSDLLFFLIWAGLILIVFSYNPIFRNREWRLWRKLKREYKTLIPEPKSLQTSSIFMWIGEGFRFRVILWHNTNRVSVHKEDECILHTGWKESEHLYTLMATYNYVAKD